MKTISISSPKVDSEWLFDQAGSESLYLNLPDGRAYILHTVDDGDLEAAQIAANEELMALIFQRPTKTHRMDEAKAMLGL